MSDVPICATSAACAGVICDSVKGEESKKGVGVDDKGVEELGTKDERGISVQG
jgi:hypothetical protein